MLRTRAMWTVGALALVLAVTGCAADSPSGAPVRLPDETAPPSPGFSGAYAVEYEDAWRSSTSDFVREVLRDEKVTDQEWAEVATRMTRCFAEQGLEFGGYEVDGAYSIEPSEMDSDRVNDLMAVCEIESGDHPLGYLRREAITNPENRDFAEIMIACLERKGAIGPGYDRADFEQDYASLAFPYLDPVAGPELFWDCNEDPLDLVGGE